MKRSMQRITDPVALSELKSLATALVILKPLIDVDPVYIDTSHFSDAERERFKKALLDLGEPIRESLKLSQRGKEEELIAQIRLECIAQVYEHLDQFFSEHPDWLNKKPNAIAKHIHPKLETILKAIPEKERPHLKGRTTVRNYVKGYLRRRVKQPARCTTVRERKGA